MDVTRACGVRSFVRPMLTPGPGGDRPACRRQNNVSGWPVGTLLDDCVETLVCLSLILYNFDFYFGAFMYGQGSAKTF